MLKLPKYKFLLFVFFVFAGCSTEKNTITPRNYHNLVSHYNIYFNGMESYRKGLNKAEGSIPDNYSQVLRMFYYTDKSISQSVSPDMDQVAKKATKVITLHSITAKPELKKGTQNSREKAFYDQKEYNKWVDESYMLLGKSYVYKNEYGLAMETFKHVITDFPETDSRTEALIWLARCYSDTNEPREAQRILESLQSEKELPKKLRADFYLTFADYYIKQENYSKAAEMLEKALENKMKKTRRIRYTYILAQLYQRTENFSRSAEKYREVISLNPPYEMTFNAKINLAGTFDTRTGEGKEIRGILSKMLKDEKNKEFHDQIYYALGNIEMKENNVDKAIEFYKRSAKESINNSNQKGLTYLTLAEINYERHNYAEAKAYYDSTLQNINKEFENYADINTKAVSLTNLVTNLNVYQLEDSLQVLAKMTENERLKVIDNLIAAVIVKEQEEAKKKQEESRENQFGIIDQNRLPSNVLNTGGENAGKWYFYNPNAKSFGQPEFRMKWGNRKLEDNWRRNNKQTVEAFEQTETKVVPDSAGKAVAETVKDNKSREYYLKDIPFTDEALAKSNERLRNGLFNTGIIYLDELKDTVNAISSFEEFVSRYPEDEKALTSYYYLYEIYRNKGDAQRSEQYKNLIISKFPDSPVSKMLSNPDFIREMENQANAGNRFYEETYEKYRNSDFPGVLNNVGIAQEKFRNNEVMPRFMLLKALSLGQLQGKEVLKQELDSIVKKYPAHESGIYARELIEHIYSQSPELKISDTRIEAEKTYSFSPDERQLFVLAAPKKLNINQLNFNVINFNLDNFNDVNLGISQEEIGDTSLLVVTSFPEAKTAKAYRDAITNNINVLKGFDPLDVMMFIISESNFLILKEDKDIAKYYLYYGQHY